MNIYVNLTEDHIKLIRNLYIQNINDNVVGIYKDDIYGGTNKYEQMAMILGVTDKVIKDTEEDINGALYEKEVQDYMSDLDAYIKENLLNIEEILHQFLGITAGKYKCKDYQHIWQKVE